MIKGINLHAVVRPVINTLHPDIEVVLYLSLGQDVASGGKVIAQYSEGIPLKAQMQSESATTLYHADRVGMENINRRFYFFSDQDTMSRISSIYRPKERNGDMFMVAADNGWMAGTWWLIDAVTEDFTRSGWINVRATLQVYPPEGIPEEPQP